MSLVSQGVYRCEVSNEFPNFLTVSKSVNLEVIGEFKPLDVSSHELSYFLAIPRGPFVSPQLVTAGVSDQLDINCSVYNALPRPNIVWYINSGNYHHTLSA